MRGLDTYRENTNKDRWRRWEWDMFAQFCPVPVPEATVLYLAGPDDRDRREARQRGFRPEGLIAVDDDEENVSRVRSRRGLAIRGELHELLWAWPADWPIHAIAADLCGGLDRTAALLASAILFSPARAKGAVVVVNMQRGRDALSNAWRENTNDVFRRHRGAGFLFALASAARAASGDDSPLAAEMIDPARMPFMPRIASYRSRRVTMDSIAFALPWANRQTPAGVDLATRRRITALRAVRTVRIRQWSA